MNIPKKIFCRTFQSVLHAALPVLPYRMPGQMKSVEEIPAVLHSNGIDCVLVITDAGVRSAGLTEPLEHLLKDSGIRCIVYDKTVANPTDVNVEEARSLYVDEGCKALIGFGGGSSMDCAKAVGARIVKPHQSLARMEGILKIHRKLPPLFAVPTTAGTGSETTVAAVVTDSKTHHKYAITDFYLIPDYAVLDPEVTRTLPPFITACTAMDAMTHAIEAYIGRSTSKETRRDATEAVRLIFAYLDRAFLNGNDMEARGQLLHAAFLAGNAFSKSYVGYVHAIAHSLSGKYNVPHGFANAVLLPHVLESYGSVIHEKLARLAEAAGVSNAGEKPAEAAAALIRSIREMNCRFGIPEHISELQEEDIPELSRTADREGNPLYPVPVLMDAGQLQTLYYKVLEVFHENRRDTESDRGTEGILRRGENTAGGTSGGIAQKTEGGTGAA